MTSIFIVDDHESMRESLATVLAAEENFTVVGDISSAAHAAAYCEKLRPDLVLMDIFAPRVEQRCLAATMPRAFAR